MQKGGIEPNRAKRRLEDRKNIKDGSDKGKRLIDWRESIRQWVRNPITWIIAFVGAGILLGVIVGKGKSTLREGEVPRYGNLGEWPSGSTASNGKPRDSLPFIPDSWGTDEQRRVYSLSLFRWREAWDRLVSFASEKWREAESVRDQHWPTGSRPQSRRSLFAEHDGLHGSKPTPSKRKGMA